MSVNTARGSWDWISLQGIPRPFPTLPESQKDEAYDAACARFYLSQQDEAQIKMFRKAYATNVAYASDSRWGEEEDIKTFLKDKGRSTSRVALKNPLVQPMLTRLRGAADNISVAPMAETATQFAKTRKEEDLNRALAMSLAARGSDVVAAAFSPMGISPDEEQTRSNHDNDWQDELVIAINSLVKMNAVHNGLDDWKREIAKHLALSGLVAGHCSPMGHNLVWELCEPDEVGWDPSATRPDFADGSYVFTCPLMDISTIAEKYNVKSDIIEKLSHWATGKGEAGAGEPGWPNAKPRVVTVYFRDSKWVERGYVSIDDEPVYVTINEPDPDSRDGKPKYTYKDLITPPENQYTALWSDAEWSNKYQRKPVEQIRYCSLIPWEYLPGAVTQGHGYKDRKKSSYYAQLSEHGCTGDLVLESGVYGLQETNPDDTYCKGFPIKFATWTVIAGHVIAPLTAAISPQRVMNQITSDLMYRLRKAGHKSPAIDTDAMAGSTMSEQEIAFAMKEGDLINLKGAVIGGLQNAVRDIDTSPSTSFYNAFTMIPQIKQMAESSVGVFEQNYGAPGSPNQLVGTLQLQLQQAGVMQQPFYAAIGDWYKQAYQFVAQAGKQFYTRRPWILKQMVGEISADVLTLCRDLQNEQFRIQIILTPNAGEMRAMVDNQVIPGRMQMGILDPAAAANLFGKSFPADVDRAGRESVKRMAQAAEQQQQMQAQAMEAQAAAAEQQAIDENDMRLMEMQARAEGEDKKIAQKLQQPYEQAQARHLEPQEDPMQASGVA